MNSAGDAFKIQHQRLLVNEDDRGEHVAGVEHLPQLRKGVCLYLLAVPHIVLHYVLVDGIRQLFWRLLYLLLHRHVHGNSSAQQPLHEVHFVNERERREDAGNSIVCLPRLLHTFDEVSEHRVIAG